MDLVRSDSSCCGEGAIQSLTMKYAKQDASEALNWRPSQYWNCNADYTFERYDWTQADVTATNENSGKISVDYKPFIWLTARSSASYGYRTYENYNYVNNVCSIQIPNASHAADWYAGRPATPPVRKARSVMQRLSAVHVRQPPTNQRPICLGRSGVPAHHSVAHDQI